MSYVVKTDPAKFDQVAVKLMEEGFIMIFDPPELRLEICPDEMGFVEGIDGVLSVERNS